MLGEGLPSSTLMFNCDQLVIHKLIQNRWPVNSWLLVFAQTENNIYHIEHIDLACSFSKSVDFLNLLSLFYSFFSNVLLHISTLADREFCF